MHCVQNEFDDACIPRALTNDRPFSFSGGSITLFSGFRCGKFLWLCVFSLLYNSFAFLCNSCSYATTFPLDFYQRQTQYRNWAGRTLIACNGPMGFPVITWGQYLASWCCLEQPSSATLVVTCCRRTCLTCFACRHVTITTLLRLMWFLCEIPPAQ